MTSKKALERLYNMACVEAGPTKEKFITYARETEHNKTCSELYNAIKQDLDRLEKLEKAIEILKKKQVSSIMIWNSIDVSDYNLYRQEIPQLQLNDEEYELLKEYL